MPITNNVSWDPGLEAFKGRDTTSYVEATAATATSCAACGQALGATAPSSLTVDVTGGKDPDGTEYFSFDFEICHRSCRLPSLTFSQGRGAPVDFTTQAARLVLEDRKDGTTTAAIVFTYTPMPSFRERGGELTSALVAALLAQGFQLAMSADYGEILRQSKPPIEGFGCTITSDGLVWLHAGEEVMYREQLDPNDDNFAAWLDAALASQVLVISGDNLSLTETGLNLEAAARFGTLVTALVPVHAAHPAGPERPPGLSVCETESPQSTSGALHSPGTSA